jgi:ligand-binding sensor domain-containing protein
MRFEHIGIEDGLLNENVTAMLQDSKGFMWFGTFDGLYKYDAYSFTKYQFDPSDSNSLSQNFIYTIFEDRYGTIWVSTFEGLCKFNRSTEKFTRYRPSENAEFSNPNISSIEEDRDGMIWAGSFGEHGLCRFNRQTGAFLPDSFDVGGVSCLYKDSDGTLWAGTSKGLYKINLTEKKAGRLAQISFTHHQNDATSQDSLSSNMVKSIFEDRAGMLWLATDNGLNSFDRKTGKFKRYQNNPKNIHSISSNNLAVWMGNGIKEDQDGNLWISTAKGLNKLNRDRTLFTSYFHNPNDAYSLSSDYIICLQIDKEGILWVASQAGSVLNAWKGVKLNKANLNGEVFGLRRNDPNNVNSLSENQVTAIVEDSQGIIWIGTHGGGLNRWDKKTNQFTHFRSDSANPKKLRDDAITAMLVDRHGHLWVCNGNVLSQLNQQTGEFTHYSTLNDQRILSIAEDQQGLFWIGSNSLCSFDEKTGEFVDSFQHDPKNPEGMSDYTVSAIFVDSKDNIWIGHGSEGTDRYNKKTKRFTHYKYNSYDSTSISSNIVNSFYEDTNGNLWLGTWAGGLSYFDYKKERFKTFTDKDGLAGTTVFSIVKDNSGYLWLGTRNGLSRFDPNTKIFKNYDYTDGLQGNIFAAGFRERGAHCEGSDGTLYFGGSDGLSFFNPLDFKTNSHRAPIAITQFKLFDKQWIGANESKEIVLGYDQNYFSFEFSSLSFYNPAKNQYAYKLQGVDKDWVYSGSRRYAGYTNIEPGKYTFMVKGTNNDGVWNEDGSSMIVIIKPPWYKTWWAYTLFILSLAGLVYAFIRYRINKIRMQHEIVVQKHKAADLEMQALRAQMNPHFIFNSLNSINRFILQNNKEQASEYLTKFSRLVRLILQNSNASLITLENELEALQLYLELESLRFNHRFNFKISLHDEIDAEVIKVPPLIIQPYAENAIWHGLMQKDDVGNLEIEIKQEENFLQIKISDDGIGRKKAAALKSKSTTSQKSMGLRITEDRIGIMNGNENKGMVVIKDLKLADGSDGGTEVILKMPLVQ